MSWWGKGPDKPTAPAPAKESPAKESPAEGTDGLKRDALKEQAKFDPDKLPDREKLPPELQKIVDKDDKEESFYDELVSG